MFANLARLTGICSSVEQADPQTAGCLFLLDYSINLNNNKHSDLFCPLTGEAVWTLASGFLEDGGDRDGHAGLEGEQKVLLPATEPTLAPPPANAETTSQISAAQR